MSKIFKLKGKVQNYAWGGTEFIPKLLGNKVTGSKNAEYWLGAHNNAPSQVITDIEKKSLNTFLGENLTESLGYSISQKFGRLPYLFKVLDVKEMLSIQVHPTKKEAEKGFKRENKLGIPVDAPNRNYKDDNHKPEIMVALSEFWLLHGFLTEEKLINNLDQVPELKPLIGLFQSKGYFGLYKKVMTEPHEDTVNTLRPLIDRILPLYRSGKLMKSSPDYWAAKTVVSNNNDISNLDKGIYSIYFFNLLKVDKGDAVFQDAGIPHAYLEGQNMELMANSDNVLRGGLTPKHVDVKELLKHVVFKPTVPNIIKGDLQNDGLERIYKSPAPDFELSQIILKNEQVYHSKNKTVSIIIVFEGNGVLSENGKKLHLNKGESALILADSEYKITSDSKAIIYKATAPI